VWFLRKQERFLETIKKLLYTDTIEITDIYKGSTEVRLCLSIEQSEALFWAVKRGELSRIDVVDAKLIGSAIVTSIIEFKRCNGVYDVFLCHNSSDKSDVQTIGERLMRFGILPWLDEWELRPGLPWQRSLEEQISSIKSAAVFVGILALART
jgi:hypothetical protein